MHTSTLQDNRLTFNLRVSEIFKSIQGESTWAGLPCGFVRLTGCHIRCAWCDTEYAMSGGETMPLGGILDRVAEMNVPLVEVTGGEPLLQENCIALIDLLLLRDYVVLVETSGTVPVHNLPVSAIKIMDIKCPGSGVSDRNDFSNIEALSPADEVKFVIADRGDYLWARDVIRKYNLPERCKQVLLSPVYNAVEPRDIVKWMLEDELDARFQLPLHKYIWGPDQRGV
jgi:7-carboxy-7-deazaguanine synthase